ncbi:MAG TPA: carboxypeptidase regulatory-like domain-containing protein [Gemmatimonadaceae bacterium]|nr:carboxypeptidase regulatory-like domain-containing protein [Gemmatimonadaceae bacterium]
MTALGLVLAAVVATDAHAQGITTGGVTGFVTDSSGAPLENAQVAITNRTTGVTQRATSRDGGRYSLTSLEVGGPYTLEARRIGYAPYTRTNIYIQLSQNDRIDIRLSPQATQLAELEVRATTGEIIAPTNTGTKTTISAQALERSATTTRNLVDFTKAAPQVSSSGPGFSGGGMSNRMNNVQIDGATERDVFGLGSTGQPGGQISAKAISIDAIKEYQILLAPYDVRQGNFGGLLLNAVTKSGTNEWHGSAFKYYRNQDYGRDVSVLRATDFYRHQTGFSLGGPIIKDKLHFFTANEWTRESTPVTGPYQGQPADASTKFPFSDADITRFIAAYKAKSGGEDPGTAGILNSPTPMNNLFGRLDWQISSANRLVARMNYTDATNNARRQNARSATTAVLSSNFHSINSNKKAPVVQLFSNFSNGMSNEAFAGITWVRDRRNPATSTFPQVTVNVPRTSNRIIAGADQFSQGNELDADTYEFTDNLTIPRGNHSFVVGTRNEYVKIRNLFSQSSYGVWVFDSIQSFEAGTPSGFRRGIILGDDPNVYFDALQTAIYAQDTWTASPKLTMTLGIRGDISNFLTDNKYAPAIDSAYPGHTTPTGAFQFSPRLGFNYDVTGDQVNQLRGGIGVFVGTPPYVWMENAYAQNGQVITFLQCGASFGNRDNPAPLFSKDPTIYNTCANGQGAKPIGDVSFLDKSLKFPQPVRANLAFDRVLPGNLVGTIEGLYSRTLNQLFFVNRNLTDPTATDKYGRAMYGTLATTGLATTARPALVLANGGTARFSTAIDVENQNKDYAYNLTAQLRKRYSNGWEALVAYNYGRAYDVQSFTSSTHISNWSFGRTIGGTPQLTPEVTTSLFDQPHKISAFITKTLGWGRLINSGWAEGLGTDVTLSYQGVSGSTHDYVYGGSGGRGDANADGIVGNDLIYVPKDVNDVNEIRFANGTFAGETLTAADEAKAFNDLIEMTPCLKNARGTIMERNSCRLPFSNNFDLSVRQNIPLVSNSQRVAVQLDIFNFGNLLNKKWGQQQVSPYGSFNNISLLNITNMTSTDPATAVPTVTFNYRTLDPKKTGKIDPYQVGNFVSNYWRMQLSARVSF